MMKLRTKITIGTILVFCAVWVGLGCWLYIYGIEHRKLANWQMSVINMLKQSRTNVPNGMTSDEWDDVIDRTGVAIPNCFFTPRWIKNQERFGEFSETLRNKDASEIDLNAIRWIWDEIEMTSINGVQYSMKYRPQSVR